MARKTKPVPAVPRGTGISGARLWRDVTRRYELEENEMILLRQAVRTVDMLDKLAAAIDRDGPTIDGRMHPAVRESRQQQIVLARLLAALRLPTGDEDEQPPLRPQRRSGARGVYTFRQHGGA
jgi:hypothetical protein